MLVPAILFLNNQIDLNIFGWAGAGQARQAEARCGVGRCLNS